jgi:molecular chaperone GrpE
MTPNEPQEPNSDISKDAQEAGDIAQALAAEKEKAAQYLANWQRAQADFINYKRRIEQERQEYCTFASAGLVRALLPVLDDLERALDAVPPEFEKSDWAEGVRAVERKFRASLEAQGVKPVMALGMAFDPNFHEAVRQDKGPEGVVIGEYQKGYTLSDKLLRPARVVVGSGETEHGEDTVSSF